MARKRPPTRAELAERVTELEQELSLTRHQLNDARLRLRAEECDQWLCQHGSEPFYSTLSDVWVWDTKWGMVHSEGPLRRPPVALIEQWMREYPQDLSPEGVA